MIKATTAHHETVAQTSLSILVNMAWLCGFISVGIGFVNLLPIPMLDGGQIVYQTLEWIKGSPLSDRVQIVGQQLGIALLVLLMGVALFNDIVRQFG
jgi:regulator of sigma E protease